MGSLWNSSITLNPCIEIYCLVDDNALLCISFVKFYKKTLKELLWWCSPTPVCVWSPSQTLTLWVSQLIINWNYVMVAELSYHPKASVFEKCVYLFVPTVAGRLFSHSSLRVKVFFFCVHYTSDFMRRSVICDTTNCLEANLGSIGSIHKSDEETWSIECPYTENGLYRKEASCVRQTNLWNENICIFINSGILMRKKS